MSFIGLIFGKSIPRLGKQLLKFIGKLIGKVAFKALFKGFALAQEVVEEAAANEELDNPAKWSYAFTEFKKRFIDQFGGEARTLYTEFLLKTVLLLKKGTEDKKYFSDIWKTIS